MTSMMGPVTKHNSAFVPFKLVIMVSTKAVGCFAFLLHVSHWGKARKQDVSFQRN